MVQGSNKQHFMQPLFDDIHDFISNHAAGILLVLSILIGVGVASYTTWDLYNFEHRARETTGVVTRYVCVEDSDDNTQKCTTTARYRIANGEFITTDLSNSLDTDEVGRHIPILYDPKQPTRAEHGPVNNTSLVIVFVLTLVVTSFAIYWVFPFAGAALVIAGYILLGLWRVLAALFTFLKDLLFP
jgi:Protein of unknown function (DUF3592)